MNANPFLGVVLHAIGGVAHGSFYAPLRNLRHRRWQTGWLVQGLAAWVITPWLIAEITGTHPLAVLRQSSGKSVALAYLCSAWHPDSSPRPRGIRHVALQQSPILQDDVDKLMETRYNGKCESKSLRPFIQLNGQIPAWIRSWRPYQTCDP